MPTTDQEILKAFKGEASEGEARPQPTPSPVAPTVPTEVSDEEILRQFNSPRQSSDVTIERRRDQNDAVQQQLRLGSGGNASDPFIGTRTAAEMTGGIIGAFAGAPAGPFGVVAGGGLGAAAGSYFPEAVNALAGVFLDMDRANELSVEDRTRRAAVAAAEDIIMGGAGAALARGLPTFYSAVRSVMKTPKSAVDFARRANDEFGVRLDLISVSGRGEQVQRVLGVIPIVSRGFTKAAARRADDVAKALTAEVTNIGPTVSFDQIADEAIKGARASYSSFKAEVDRLYGVAREIGRSKNVQIIPTNMLEEAKGALAEIRENIPVGADKGTNKEIRSVVNEMIRIGRNPQGYGQVYDGIIKGKINPLIDRFTKEQRGFEQSIMVRLKDALKLDMEYHAVGDDAGEFLAALDRARKFTADGKDFFDTVTAKKFKAVDPSIFRSGNVPGASGNLRADKIFDAVFQNSSPQGMRELKGIVGDRVFNRMVGTKVNDAMRLAFVDGALDTKLFRKNLGLLAKDEGRTIKEAIRLTGAQPGRLEELIRIAEVATNTGTPNVSKFVQRRLILQGSITSAIVTAGVLSGGPISALVGVAGLVAMRRAGFVLGNPAALGLVKRSLSQTGTETALASTGVRLANLAIQGIPEMTEEEDRFWSQARERFKQAANL